MKFQEIANNIEHRIRRGDYVLRGFPGERELAAEQGISPVTARKVMRALLDRKVLGRQANGRLHVEVGSVPKTSGRRLQICFLAPAYTSHLVLAWLHALSKVVSDFDATLRPMFYTYWEESMVLEAMSSFDGVFLVSIGEALPKSLENTVRSASTCLVSLELDLAYLGVPSISLFPSPATQLLLEHLYELGHRQIDCLQAQPMNSIIGERVGQWRIWCEMTGVEGRLHEQPVHAYEQVQYRAFDMMNRLLDQGDFHATALLCTTEPAAIGAIRSVINHGLTVGKDISVCVINDEGFGRFLSPTLTALEMVRPEPYLATCLKWMERGKGTWSGPLTLQPAQVPLFIGQSTGPAPKK